MCCDDSVHKATVECLRCACRIGQHIWNCYVYHAHHYKRTNTHTHMWVAVAFSKHASFCLTSAHSVGMCTTSTESGICFQLYILLLYRVYVFVVVHAIQWEHLQTLAAVAVWDRQRKRYKNRTYTHLHPCVVFICTHIVCECVYTQTSATKTSYHRFTYRAQVLKKISTIQS